MNIPGYDIIQELGHGGMATVYLAEQLSLGRKVALKVMAPALAADRTFGDRFLREGRTVAQLSHPNILSVFDIGAVAESYYLAMEYIAGGDLKQRIKSGVLPPDQAADILKQIATALDYAHRKGIVHRDVKPENILLREDGSVVLTDFGIAKAVGSATKMTGTGMTVGTAHYMSPEQARGQQVDGRSDIYSLGVVFYEMLTGSFPFEAEDSFAIAFKHINDPAPVLPSKLSRWQPLLSQMMAKKPADRFQRGDNIISMLDRGNISPPIATSPLSSAVPPQQGKTAPAAKTEVMPKFENSRKPVDYTVRKNKSEGQKSNAHQYEKGRSWSGLIWAFIILCIVGYAFTLWLNSSSHHYRRAKQVKRAVTQVSAVPTAVDVSKSKIKKLFKQADEDLKKLRLSKPVGNNAIEKFEKILSLDAGNYKAKKGLEKVAAKYVELADKKLLKGNFDRLDAYLTQLANLKPYLKGSKVKRSIDNLKTISQWKKKVGISSHQAEQNYRRAQSRARVVVDASGNGDFTSIIDAYRQVTAGGTILVRPGKYQVKQSWKIRYSVKVIGFHPDQTQILFTGDSYGLDVMGAGEVVFSGVHLQYAGKKEVPVINLRDSHLQLLDCRVSGGVYSGIIVSGQTARLDAERAEFINNKQAGIYFTKNSRGEVVQSLFAGNQHSGVAVSKKSVPEIRKCLLVGNKGGVKVYAGGKGVFSGNLLAHNRWVNISVKGKGDPLVSNNTILQAEQGAVFVYNGGSGTFDSNRIQSGGLNGNYAGVDVAGKSTPVFENNQIGPGNGIGIRLYEQAKGVYKNNQIDVDDSFYGISVKVGTQGRFSGNTAPDGVKGMAKKDI